METRYLSNSKEFQANKHLLEQKLGITCTLQGRKVTYDAPAFKEYEAGLVFDALIFGFSVKKALMLLEPDMSFKTVHLKDHTRRKDMGEVRARMIGKEGKTKRAIENITNCDLIITDENEVGILGHVTDVEHAVVGLINLAKGTKEGNVYAYLERMNAETKRLRSDLGLKDDEKKQRLKRSADVKDDA